MENDDVLPGHGASFDCHVPCDWLFKKRFPLRWSGKENPSDSSRMASAKAIKQLYATTGPLASPQCETWYLIGALGTSASYWTDTGWLVHGVKHTSGGEEEHGGSIALGKDSEDRHNLSLMGMLKWFFPKGEGIDEGTKWSCVELEQRFSRLQISHCPEIWTWRG